MTNYKIISENGQVKKDIYEVVVDTIEDIQTLPEHFGVGSTVLVIADTTVYIKNNQGEWVMI